jgi:hypothetical protein
MPTRGQRLSRKDGAMLVVSARVKLVLGYLFVFVSLVVTPSGWGVWDIAIPAMLWGIGMGILIGWVLDA